MKRHSKQESRRSSHQGWTVLELLVVVAIIAVLGTLSFVVSQKMGQKGKEIQCTHRLRQLGVAFLAYTADNQNVIRSQLSGGNLESGWSRLIVSRGYIGGEKPWEIMQCPTAKLSETMKRSMENYSSARPNAAPGDIWRWFTYGLNMCAIPGQTKIWLGFETNGSTAARFYELPIGRIKSPSNHVLFTDSSAGPEDHWQSHSLERENKRGLALRHGSRGHLYANAFYLDGHVSRIDRKRSRQLATPQYEYGLNIHQIYVFDIEP